MADAVNLGTVTVTTGQNAKFVLTFQSTAPSAVWLFSDGGSVAVPAAADGTPLTWPHEISLTNGTGTYFILGVGSGDIEYSFHTSSDPLSTPRFASASISVMVPVAGTQPSDDESVIQVMSIAEPIVITIISEPPTNTASD